MDASDFPSLAGKVALVTGGSRGIGRAIAQRMATAGATVVVTARSLETASREPGTLRETVAMIEANGGRAIALAADLESARDREALVPRAIAAAEPLASNIAVDMIAPSTAIASPGALRYIPADCPTEDVAYLAECALQLSHLPAATGFRVLSPDGSRELPPAVRPAASHPAIVSGGE